MLLEKGWLIPGLVMLGAIAYLVHATGPDDLNEVPLVPLAFAEARGADRWSADERLQFTSDPINRWRMPSQDWRTRGALGPGDWLPSIDQCLYISRFVSVMRRYELDGHPAEMRQLTAQRQRCYTQFQ